MESTARNPLAGYFRQPAIFIKLPSNGRWWPDASLNLPINGELPVYPMSTKDEIMLKTPDALMNGQGIVNVIQSCVPNILNAWDTPTIDVDTILIAIRIASVGNAMEFDSKCPHCNEENSHEVDLTVQLQNLASPNFNESIEVKDLRIKLKPQRFFDTNRSNSIVFEEERLANALNSPESVPIEQKAKMLEESMQRLADLNIKAIANSTEYIEINGDERVSNVEFINEFFQQVDAPIVRTVQEKLKAINEETKLKPLQLQCNECGKAYALDLTFDYSSFFGKSS
jgi:hypothetical protein